VTHLFEPDTIVLSRAAAQELGVQRGGTLHGAGGRCTRKSLRVIDVLSDEVYPESLG
jgi:hypothetical protein